MTHARALLCESDASARYGSLPRWSIFALRTKRGVFFFFFFDKRIRIKGERSRLPLPSPPTEYGVDRTRETCFADIHVYYVQQPAPFRSRSQTRLELVMKTDTHTHTHTHTQGKKKGGEGGGTREERGVGGKGFGRILKNLHFILFLFLFPV